MESNHYLNQGHLYCRKDDRQVAVHRLVVEEHLGRPLTSDEVVHHIDHNPLNNDISNLKVMTRAEHLVHHLRNRPVNPWTEEELAELIRLSREGLSIDEIAKRLNKGYYPVRDRRKRARKHGLLP
jgi:DNA-directed RNA polymerase specialized sigma24 family protein